MNHALLALLAMVGSVSACGNDEEVGDGPPEADAGVDTFAPDIDEDVDPDDGSSDVDAMDATPDTDGGGGEPDVTDPGPAALALASDIGCLIDADCVGGRFCYQRACVAECDGARACASGETCSARGRCESAPGVPARPSVVDGLQLASTRDPVVQVAPGQSTLRLRMQLDGTPPAGGLLYRVERNDGLDARHEVHRVSPDAQGRFDVNLPVGDADPSGANAVVSVRIHLPFGTLPVLLQPAARDAGEYAGEVRLDGFGSAGLPIEFRLFTQPEAVPLADADAAWLALRVAPEHIFSPVEAGSTDREWVRAPLELDPLFGAWVATFRYAFDRPDAQIGPYPTGQVQRLLRIELDPPADGVILGRISDRWRGLYDQRSSLGVPDVGVVTFEGELEATWTEAIALDELPPEHIGPPAATSLQPRPSLAACEAVTFDLGAEAAACAAIGDLDDYLDAPLAQRIECGRALADAALDGATVAGALIAFLEDADETPGGLSFAEFLQRCATGTDPICRPSPTILCSRQLLAAAFYDFGNASVSDQQALAPSLPGLFERFQDVSREAYLGRQLGAFQTDVTTRVRWLRDSELPAIVTSVLEASTAQLLDEWRTSVLDVHFATLRGHFDAASLTLIGAGALEGEHDDLRRRLLRDATQAWRGTMDALVLATDRWNTLLRAPAARAGRAAWVGEVLFDLYLSAGILQQLNREAGAGLENASIAGGFGTLLRAHGRLSLSFEELAFSRDVEVVVSSSLNPLDDNDSLLSRLRATATAELEAAASSIRTLLDQMQAEALDETLLRQRFQSTIRDLRAELAELCGVPVGCTPDDARTVEACRPRVSVEECGFALERTTGDYLPYSHPQYLASEGGRIQLEVVTALQGVSIAQAELDAHLARTQLELVELARFADAIDAWNDRRLARVERMRENFARRAEVRDENIRVVLESLDAIAANRQAGIDAFQRDMAQWATIRIANATRDLSLATRELSLSSNAQALASTATLTRDISYAIAEAMPRSAGASSDPTAPARGATLSKAAKVTFGLRAASIALGVAAQRVEADRLNRAALANAEMERLRDESTRNNMVLESERAALADAIQRSTLLSAAELAFLEETLRLLLAESEAIEAYERDHDQFFQRRLAYQQRLVDTAELGLRVEQALLRVQQRLMEYLQVVQRAELLDARVADVEAQLRDVEVLIGSPTAVFAQANRLAQAEGRLNRAKSALMDWLVAMEYFAVRPFMDQRIQILLASNTFQLEAIAAEMRRIESRCGGAVNEELAVFSVRNDFLQLSEATQDVSSGLILSPAARFRAVLAAGSVPVDRRIRYRSDANIGDLMRSGRGLLAASFDVNLNDYANLAQTCNAKVTGVRVQLVGEGLGSARPTISLLYDGTAQLRSCQPDVDAIVATFGPGASNFASVTTLRTRGRSISPTAGLNDFVSTANRTLAGLPLSSQYTVLIDPEVGENRSIDWSRLEDIRLEIGYAYQDVFPVGQCP